MKKIGFNSENKPNSYLDNFIGKPGHYAVGPISATGILNEININEGYIVIQPSIVGYEQNQMRLETEMPTIITLEMGNPISMRPLREGDLENMVKTQENIKK